MADAGAVRNILVQLATQTAGVIFTGGLTLYLVRALGPSGFGLYELALGIGGLLVLPAGFGLPGAVGRFLADHRNDLDQVRAILALGLRLQLPMALAASLGLFALAGRIADAYGHPALGWPLRWAAVSVGCIAMFRLLSSVGTSVRQARVGLWMAIIESTAEAAASLTLVVTGAGAAGAALGKAIGYGVAATAGLYLTMRLFGGRHRRGGVPPNVSARTLTSYAGVLFLVDVGVSAFAQLDVLLIGALLSVAAVGGFGAVLRLLTVLGYLGIAVSGGVAPRMSLGGGSPDTRAFNQAIRYLLIVQGLVIAPMLVWSRPIVGLLLGSKYRSSAEILQVLTVVAFVSAPASVISVSVSYLGEGRRRVAIVVATLLLGLVSTYILLRTTGLVGAAIADDIVTVCYVGANLSLCARLITVDLRGLVRTTVRTLTAAGAMALVLLAVGTDHLSAWQWVAGGCVGMAVYMAVLLLTLELTPAELRAVAARLRVRSPAASP